MMKTSPSLSRQMIMILLETRTLAKSVFAPKVRACAAYRV